MKAEWEVEDGYCGKSRPQETDLDPELVEDCDSVDHAMEQVELAVEEDFANKISHFIKNRDEIKEWIQGIFEKRDESIDEEED
jgi:hypothetical protein